MNYQATRAIHWNLFGITTANAIMWCDIFHLFVGRNKKTLKTILLIFIIYFHILKTCGFFYLFHYTKIIFSLLVVGRKKNLVLTLKRRWFRSWHSSYYFVKFLWYHDDLHFPAIGIWYSRSTIMSLKTHVP